MKQIFQPTQQSIPVLDQGYVRYIDCMGTDLSIVNAARASYQKESGAMTDADSRLLAFLWENNHHSPFRHAMMTFEVKAPLMIARQWWKHVVGSDHTMEAWNEASRRYVTGETEFYTPEWREAPENKKQGSGGIMQGGHTVQFTEALRGIQEQGQEWYERAMELGVAPEQARLFLPAYGLYVNWRWTASLQSIMHFIGLREAHESQSEIRQYAEAVKSFVIEAFPAATRAITQ